MIGRAGVFLAVAGVLLGATPTGAQAADDLRCKGRAAVVLSEGLRLGVPFQSGTLATPEPALLACSGTLAGRAFTDAPARLTLEGTFGDGPVSDPAGDGSGGATCSHNDGFMRGMLRIDALGGRVTIKVRDTYWLRSAMAVIKGAGTLGGAPGTVEGLIDERDGTCLDPTKPIHRAGFRVELQAAGEIAHKRSPSRRRR